MSLEAQKYLDNAKEWENLIRRILASSYFTDSPKSSDLLRFLFERRETKLSSITVEIEFRGVPFDSPIFDSANSRNLLKSVREKLEEYTGGVKGERWVCELPLGDENEGFQLLFRETLQEFSPSQLFFGTHIETAEDIRVITGSHLFFFNARDNTILRYSDVNAEGDREDVLDALKRAREGLDTSMLEPWPNSYLAAGDVRAYELLLGWFAKHTGIIVPRVTHREITENEVSRRTPILIGRPHTNPLIRKLLRSRHAAHLDFRFNGRDGSVRIGRIQARDREGLKRFDFSGDGVIKPTEERSLAFGIFSRLRNPSGHGHTTIIVCDYYAMVIARIVEALTVAQFVQNARGFRRGERVTVDGASKEGVHVTRADGSGTFLPLDQAARFQLYQPGQVALAKGDKLRITQNGLVERETRRGLLGIKAKDRLDNGAVYEVDGFTKEGDIRLSNGFVVPKNYGGITHGFVVTSHASQGKTVDVALVALGHESFAAATREQAYVSISRGREAVRIYTDDKAAMMDAVQSSAARLSASELVQAAHRGVWQSTEYLPPPRP